tara:strand:+ start:671 stop:925 length:255 start_codon:yes stop_codon:yes gene_type:complete
MLNNEQHQTQKYIDSLSSVLDKANDRIGELEYDLNCAQLIREDDRVAKEQLQRENAKLKAKLEASEKMVEMANKIIMGIPDVTP